MPIGRKEGKAFKEPIETKYDLLSWWAQEGRRWGWRGLHGPSQRAHVYANNAGNRRGFSYRISLPEAQDLGDPWGGYGTRHVEEGLLALHDVTHGLASSVCSW